MNAEDSPATDVRVPLAQRRGLALFRVWVLLAAAGSVGGAIALDFHAPILPVWMVLAALESWCLFSSWRRRVAWIALGAFAVTILDGVTVLNENLLFIPLGVFETLACNGVRQRAWVWAPLTPLLYGTIDLWMELTDTWVDWVEDQVAVHFPAMASLMTTSLDAVAAMAVILLIRAFVGSFLIPPVIFDSPANHSIPDA
jgi:hypothetical protein